MKILQVGAVLSVFFLAYMCGVLAERSHKESPAISQPASAHIGRNSDVLSNHRAYLECAATKKVCVDPSPWTPEETEAYTQGVVHRVGAEIVGESP